MAKCPVKKWAYSNNGLWQRVYDYLDRRDTPQHRFIGVTFSTGLEYLPGTSLPSGCFYPTIKLHFSRGPYGVKTEKWLS